MSLAQDIGLQFDEIRAIAQAGCDLAKIGDHDGARVVFEGMVELNPNDASAWAALGTVYQKLGRPEDAERAYREALRFNPRHPVALGNLGELKLGRGESDAEEYLLRAASAGTATAASMRAKALLKLRATAQSGAPVSQ